MPTNSVPSGFDEDIFTSDALSRIWLNHWAVIERPETSRAVDDGRQLRRLLETEQWAELSSVSAQIYGGAAHQVINLASTGSKLSRNEYLGADAAHIGYGPDFREHYNMFVDLLVDASQAQAVARFNAGLIPHSLHLPEMYDADSLEDVHRKFAGQRQRTLVALHTAVSRAQWQLVRNYCIDVIMSVPNQIAQIAQVLTGAVRHREHPFSATENTRPRKWTAQVAMLMSGELRQWYGLLAIAGDLLYSCAIAHGFRQESEADICQHARSLPVRSQIETAVDSRGAINHGVDARVSQLVGQPDKYEGEPVEVFGVARRVEFIRQGRKFDTFITVAQNYSATSPAVMVRAHFHNLVNYGLREGAFVHINGDFSVAHSWAPGKPAIALGKISLAENQSWSDQMLHRARFHFEPFPNNAHIRWSETPLHQATNLAGSSEILFRPIFRSTS